MNAPFEAAIFAWPPGDSTPFFIQLLKKIKLKKKLNNVR